MVTVNENLLELDFGIVESDYEEDALKEVNNHELNNKTSFRPACIREIIRDMQRMMFSRLYGMI
jgi:hypothetical protein